MTRARLAPLALLAVLVNAAVLAPLQRATRRGLVKPRRVHERAANGFDIDLGHILGFVFALIGIVIVFKISASLAPTLFGALADLVNVFKTNTTNDTTGDALAKIGGLVIAVIFVLGLIVLLMRAAGLGFGSGRQG
jgi:small-conductance mechanosensitive channel